MTILVASERVAATLLLVLGVCAGGCGTRDQAVPKRASGEPSTTTTAPADAGADASQRAHPGPDADPDRMSDKHTTFDDNAAPINHTDSLWGDYIDAQGRPAVGWHAHDPATGKVR